MTIINKNALLIALTTLAIVSAVFWLDRYTALEHKAEIIGKLALNDKLSPDAGIADNAADKPLYLRALITFGNWAYTNWKGMSFGIVFGAILLALLHYVGVANSRNPFVGSLKGAILGLPLGVCSNCAAPVAKGVGRSGISTETALAMMVASPTLNIIVLTMVFAAFPLKIALLKLAGTFLLVLGVVPLISRSGYTPPSITCADSVVVESWKEAGDRFVRDLGKNLWFLVSRTVPLMILGGLLGAVLVQAVDLQAMASGGGVGGLLGIAFVGTFLPVPMAFDVLLSQGLMSAGMSLSAVTTLLLTLGSYSIFSFSVVWQSFGKAIAIKLFLAVMLLGFLAGLMV